MTAKKTRKLNKRRLLTVTCIALLAYFGVLVIQQEIELHSIEQQKQELQQQIEEAQAEGNAYRSAIEKVESETYVEREARDKLGLVKDGELQFIAKPED
jgi:cell division protein FtsB